MSVWGLDIDSAADLLVLSCWEALVYVNYLTFNMNDQLNTEFSKKFYMAYFQGGQISDNQTCYGIGQLVMPHYWYTSPVS